VTWFLERAHADRGTGGEGARAARKTPRLLTEDEILGAAGVEEAAGAARDSRLLA
jgi:hypothetical protein